MDTIQIGDRLPDVRLPRADGGVRPLRGPHRDAVVVVALHDPACQPCRSYLHTLADHDGRFRLWDGGVQAVTPGESPGAGSDGASSGGSGTAAPRALQEALGGGIDVLLDPDRALLDRVDAAVGPVTLVADRYGQLFHTEEAGAEHALMEPRELEEWLKYLATQCPE